MIRTARALVVAGIMSGTSADGVDVALARIAPGKSGDTPRVKLLGHWGFAYPAALRTQVSRAMEGELMMAAEFSRLNWRLGALYADCASKAADRLGRKIGLVGLHGQTVFHDAAKATWQLGEAAVLRERLGVPVVGDFRVADVAAGGQGAPLVPMLDYCLFRSPSRNRVLLNLGGIANLTAIPAGAALDGVLAFDTGPANMVVDGIMHAEFGKPFDRGGRIAARGRILPEVLAQMMREPYFAASPPKSCGREQFGSAFSKRFRARVQATGGSIEAAVATATELTSSSILDAYGRFCWPHLGQRAPLAHGTDLIAAGGGVKNATLMRRLTSGFAQFGVKVRTIDEFGVASQAKEALAFALLAWLSWHGLPGNVASATGAEGPRTLGKVTC